MREKIDVVWPSILIFGAFAIGLIVGNLQYTEHWKPGWEMVSGLGTFVAAAVALWLSGIDTRRRNEEADARMRLTAARLYLPISEVSSRLGYISFTVRESYRSTCGQETYQVLLDELRRANLSVTHEELLSLAQLPNRSAYLLAGAIGNIRVAIELLENSKFAFCSEEYHGWCRVIMTRIEFFATEAMQQLGKVAQECQKVSITLTSPHH